MVGPNALYRTCIVGEGLQTCEGKMGQDDSPKPVRLLTQSGCCRKAKSYKAVRLPPVSPSERRQSISVQPTFPQSSKLIETQVSYKVNRICNFNLGFEDGLTWYLKLEILSSNIMESSTTSLSQPWKKWYKAEKSLDINPLNKPISLSHAGQGSLPQKPRKVDLSSMATSLAVSAEAK